MNAAPHRTDNSNRSRLEAALAGEDVNWPVYAVYDWFVQNRPADWPRFFDLGLGEINHATAVKHKRPNVEIVETVSEHESGATRCDTRWVTDIGELHEWRLGEWKQEYLIKTPADYRIMAHALAETTVEAAPEAYVDSERRVGNNGLTFAVPELRRTAFQKIQIDYAGLERFSLDIAVAEPALMNLIELMNDLTFREFAWLAAMEPVRHIKLWENLTIETMGPDLYRQHLVPVYRRLLDITQAGGQKLAVHYDGKLRVIADDIRNLALDGIDSFTQPPEGDMCVAEARATWPEKMLWLHPCLGWYAQSADMLASRLRTMVRAAAGKRFCLMISEEVPPNADETIPHVLAVLKPCN